MVIVFHVIKKKEVQNSIKSIFYMALVVEVSAIFFSKVF